VPKHHDETTEQAILRAARDLLGAHPGRRLTMDAVARAANVSRSGAYHYFRGRDELMLRLVGDAALAMRWAAAPYVVGTRDPRRELRQALARVIDAFAIHGPAMQALAQGPQRSPVACGTIHRGLRCGTAARIHRDRVARAAPPGPPAEPLAAALVRITQHSLQRSMTTSENAGNDVVLLESIWWRAIYASP